MVLPKIGSFWAGLELSFLEQLCLQSFVDCGHEVTLYSYDKIRNAPKGVKLVDASKIVPDPHRCAHMKVGNLAAFSDRFRMLMIQKTGEVWVDCDVVCLKPLPDDPYLIAPASPRQLCNAVFRLPPESPALQGLLKMLNRPDPFFEADWRNERPIRRVVREKGVELLPAEEGGFTVSLDDLPKMHYTLFGPIAVNYFLKKTGESAHALGAKAFNPFDPFSIRKNYFRPQRNPLELTDESYTVHHIGGKPMRKKFARQEEFVPPHPASLIGKLCKKHEIDPMGAPPRVNY
ncbi:hypothetical protein O2N63_16500 [Aliiroseovarius sp. KMU-50]|uniref:Alpha 1,4-glycosyltransferase domain-containing protein n=1 Tax=Aliiroseovarius salicola TaxID=3009082 RepID=A0ABT4W597_9RHOB|nr:hypothetical protein [Aliiroseovarius sp. KMU-50]MDA5095693.1 hypothetical protein [Aliiroseovarius sp. KMU-50]